jgi:hypothetical protein
MFRAGLASVVHFDKWHNSLLRRVGRVSSQHLHRIVMLKSSSSASANVDRMCFSTVSSFMNLLLVPLADRNHQIQLAATRKMVSPDSTIFTTGRNVWPAFGDSTALSGGSCAIAVESLAVVAAQNRSPATLIRMSENACVILHSRFRTHLLADLRTP